MKILNLALVLFLPSMLLAISSPRFDHDDMCAYPNESVTKFCKKSLGSSFAQAMQYCLAEKADGPKGSISLHVEWPIEMSHFWISSLFGPRTYRGVTKMHGGIDMAAFKGTQVKAAAAGKVIRVDLAAKGYGSMIEILHKGGVVTRYGHLDDIDVHEGDKVDLGEKIGTVGATGNARGTNDPSHLHFEIINKKGQRVDPLKYLYCSKIL